MQVEAAEQAVPEVTSPEAPAVFAPAPLVAAKRRPRGRTTLIIAAAAVLGIAAGTAVGYGVQADRAPTPLTALSQPDLAYPAKSLPAGQVPDPLPASQDRQVRTDGDLRKLLIPRPGGWRDNEDVTPVQDGWVAVEDYALAFEDEAYMYDKLLATGIRRIAATSWKRSAHRVANISLVQFRSGTGSSGAAAHAESQRWYMPEDENGAGNEGDAIKGSGSGRYYLYKVDRKAGYMPNYRARAVFHRGDVMVDINMFDTVPISKKDIRTLAERQLERL